MIVGLGHWPLGLELWLKSERFECGIMLWIENCIRRTMERDDDGNIIIYNIFLFFYSKKLRILYMGCNLISHAADERLVRELQAANTPTNTEHRCGPL